MTANERYIRGVLSVIAALGVTLILLSGAVIPRAFGPAGGIAVGFAFGSWMTYRTMIDAVRGLGRTPDSSRAAGKRRA